jgi:hypothetical protein
MMERKLDFCVLGTTPLPQQMMGIITFNPASSFDKLR